MKITDVAISYDTQWVNIFCKTLQSNYGKSPYFIYYIDEIRALLDQNQSKLLDLNLLILDWVISSFQLPIVWKTTDKYESIASEGIEDLRQQFTIQRDRKNQDLVPYPQLFEDRFGFVPNVSILDAIFCTGPEVIKYVT